MSTESIKRIPIEAWGWEQSLCSYCGAKASMFYIDKYACFEHRNTLLAEKSNNSDLTESEIRQVHEMEEEIRAP